MNKFIQYLKDVRTELTKVSWPTREEAIGGTVLVIILSLLMSIMVRGFDLVLTKVLGFVLNM